MSECDAGRNAFYGGKWSEPCTEEAHHQIMSPSQESISLCEEHFHEIARAGLVDSIAAIGIGAHGQMHVITSSPTGNSFHRDVIADDVFIIRDPTMAVPELMRCPKCREFIVEGSRCTFIGDYYRHLVHASCVGL